MSTLDTEDKVWLNDTIYKYAKIISGMSTLGAEDKVWLNDTIYKIVRDFQLETAENIDDAKIEILERKYDADVLQQTFDDFLYDLKRRMDGER